MTRLTRAVKVVSESLGQRQASDLGYLTGAWIREQLSEVLKFGVDANRKIAPARWKESRLGRRNDILRALLQSKGYNSIFDVGARKKRRAKKVEKSPREQTNDLLYEKRLIELSGR